MDQENIGDAGICEEKKNQTVSTAGASACASIMTKSRFIHSFNANTIVDKYEFLEQIGSGSFGMVMRAKCKKTEEIVAIKLIKKDKVKDPKLLANEVSHLVMLDHPNIIKLQEFYQNEEFLFMVQEFCECSFSDFLKKNKLTEDMLKLILKQLLSALLYCHKLGVIHRDIKFQNIMFSNNQDVTSLKLIDFGLSTQIDKKKPMISQATGTAVYLAPEVILGEYDEKVDIWSVGVLVYYMLNGVPPFHGTTPRELYENILHGFSINYIPKVQGASKELNDLIARLLKYDKNERISASQALKHVFLILKSPPKSNPTLLDDLILGRMVEFLQKNQFLKLLSFQYSARWNDSYCKPLKESLAMIDADNDGIISYQEFMQAFELYNTYGARKFSKSQSDTIFHILDANDNGQIDYLEFQSLFAAQALFQDEKSLLNEFRTIDSNGDGFIDAAEIKQHLSKYQGELSDALIADMISDIDQNSDGKISFEELKASVSKKTLPFGLGF